MYKHILIPIDGTALSDSAVDKGLAFAREIGARVTVLMTIEPAPIVMMAMVQLTEQQARYHQHASEQAARHLGEALAKAKAAGPVATARCASFPSQALLSICRGRPETDLAQRRVRKVMDQRAASSSAILCSQSFRASPSR